MSAPAPWWRGASVYQVYVRSFADGNGDGQGDFAGLIQKLDYIAALGVDAVWLSPIHPSPNRDWGYDVSDYDGVHPDYGTLDDFTALVNAAHARGLKIILDEVLAHTSDEHAWFAASRDGTAEKADWYVWADPKDDGTVPNNWLSVFGGPAWSYQPARRQYYHHKFLRQQPKLNWRQPSERAAAQAELVYLLALGGRGMCPVGAYAFLHDTGLRDNPAIPAGERGAAEWAAAANMQRHLFDSNLAESIVVLDIIRCRVEAKRGEKFVFGEFSEEFERSGCYLSPEAGLHCGYNFALLLATDEAAIHAHLQTLARFPDHWPAISFSNHDVIRTATRFGAANAKALLSLLFALRGTALLYQGEELGLPEVALRRAQLRDPVGDLYYPLFRGRDGCRTPMPWDGSAHLGFTSGTPWLPLGPDHAALTVAAQQADPGSALCHARAMLAARKAYPALRTGSLDLLDAPLAFVRTQGDQRIVCAFNLTDVARAMALPGPPPEPLRPLPFGTGEAVVDGQRLVLGPHAAFFGLL